LAASKSGRAEIIVGDGFRRHTLAASRPEIIRLMRAQMLLLRDTWLLEFEGTREELVAAGLADAALFGSGKSLSRSGFDEFGNKYDLTATESGRFRLILRTRADDYLGDAPARFKSWRTHRARLRADVADALERVRRSDAVNSRRER
jgi:hypothetical protein